MSNTRQQSDFYQTTLNFSPSAITSSHTSSVHLSINVTNGPASNSSDSKLQKEHTDLDLVSSNLKLVDYPLSDEDTVDLTGARRRIVYLSYSMHRMYSVT